MNNIEEKLNKILSDLVDDAISFIVAREDILFVTRSQIISDVRAMIGEEKKEEECSCDYEDGGCGCEVEDFNDYRSQLLISLDKYEKEI